MFVLPSDLRPENVLMYLRKSRMDDPSLTIAETLAKHEQLLNDYAQQKWGALVPEENRFREIVSGETIDARPEVQKVLRLIEQPRYRALLIVEPQRLSRGDLEDIGRLSKILRYTGTLIITLQGVFDLADERDRDYFESELKRGNDYLEYSKRIMQNGLRVCVENGFFVGSRPPYGYRKVSYKENKRTVRTLEIVPDEAAAVRMIFQLYAAGNGAATVCKVLNDSGVPPRYADIWRPPVVYRILANPHYLGLVRYEHTKMRRVVVDGEIVKQRHYQPDAETFPGRHEAIISRELWDAVQQARRERHLPPVRSHLDVQNPLAGLVYCECGRCMAKASRVGARRPRIQCIDQARCGNASCTIDTLLRMIADALRRELADVSVRAGADRAAAETAHTRVRSLEARHASLAAKQDALWEKYAEDGMPRDVLDRLLEKNQRELAECADALTAARDDAARADSAETVEESLYAALDVLQRENAPVKETNALLRAIIHRITYRRVRAHYDESGRWVQPPPELRIELRV